MTTMLVAVDYDILRGLSPSGRVAVPLERKPVRVATMLREDAFLATGGVMKHHTTVFFEDESHDWRWDEGRFWYYTRIADKADVLVVYETVRVGPFSPGDWVSDFSSKQKLHRARRFMAAHFVSDVFERQLSELRSLSEGPVVSPWFWSRCLAISSTMWTDSQRTGRSSSTNGWHRTRASPLSCYITPKKSLRRHRRLQH